jgi:hypothetical protein
MVQFSKRDNVYRIVRITGRQDNILGVCFSESDRGLIARLIRHSHSGNEFKEVGGVN